MRVNLHSGAKMFFEETNPAKLKQKSLEIVNMRDSARVHCKRVFVGTSRPSHLLCLAISSEHIADAQITALATNGWKFEKSARDLSLAAANLPHLVPVNG
jgi:hypothetical protein